jgi:hypothetical protein
MVLWTSSEHHCLAMPTELSISHVHTNFLNFVQGLIERSKIPVSYFTFTGNICGTVTIVSGVDFRQEAGS